ncbi:hypothetical protein KBD09_02330 [Candidatus Woesebacteria bacterium]|nr:hypothetical protein [Candidatus Woesebacteria bacterium]
MSLKLPTSLTTVTPLSKLIALILFVSLPFLGFYLGVQYGKLQIKAVENEPQTKIVRITKEEDQKDLLKRCGTDSLLDLVIPKEHFTQINGPLLSPDCRHIAWSSWESGTSGMYVQEPEGHEGLFIYSEKTGKTERVVVPERGKSVSIQRWIDGETIEYMIETEVFTYELNSN